MALPYSPRTTFDLTVDLSTNDVRTYDSATYLGKHVRVIPKKAIDTAAGLLFNGCASVTIIGGHFKPVSQGSYATGQTAHGALTFDGVAAVYLEGVILDNSSIFGNGGDGLYVEADATLTAITLQNCHFTNVRGDAANSDAFGEIIQTGANGFGKTGAVNIYNCSFGGNYHGLYLPPEAGGGITSLTLNRVNLYRTQQVTPIPRLIYLMQASANYDSFGYPVTFTNVYANPGAGQAIADAVWPSTSGFAAKYLATIGSDATGTYATYAGLTDAGKVVSGKIYQGDPPTGDYAPQSLIGINYVQGTDLAVTPTAGDPWIPASDGNLLLPQNWSTGTGVTINANTGQIDLAATGTRILTTQSVTTEIGARYRFTYHVNSATNIMAFAGTTPGTSNIFGEFYRTPAPGDIALEFTATTTTAYFGFSRTATGTTRASSIILEKLPTGYTKARRLDGIAQHFSLDVQAGGLRTANNNWFIGGWVKWTYIPTATVYLLDFGDPATSAGTARVRLGWDTPNNKLFASTSSQDGTSYRECAYTTGLQRDVWYHVGVLCPNGGDVQLYLNGVAVGTKTGPVPAVSTTICKLLGFGARMGTTRSNFNPARYADWIWTSNATPTTAQIAALADGARPNAVAGFAPTYWWPFEATSTTEDSLAGVAVLTAVGDPATVAGPFSTATVVPVTSSAPLDFIVI